MKPDSTLLKPFIQVSILFSFGYIGATYFTGFLFARYLISACVPLFLLQWYLIRFSKLMPTLVQAFIGLCTAVNFLLCLYSGGINSLVLCWFALIPVLSLLLANIATTVFWSLVSILLILTLSTLDVSNSTLYYSPPNPGLFNASLAIGLLGIISWTVSIFHRKQRDLQQKLSDTIQEMKATDEELRQNMEELSTAQEMLQQSNNQLLSTMEEISNTNRLLGEKGTELLSKQRKLEFYGGVLRQITKLDSMRKGDLELFLQDLLRITAESMGITRASVWFFAEEGRILDCRLLYLKETGTFDRGVRLSELDFPSYFKEVKSETIIAASEAEVHPATMEFKVNYLIPNQIKSMLDTPILIDGVIMGVICLEQQHQYFYWAEEDKTYARSLGDLIAVGIQSYYSHNANSKLEEQANQIFEQHEELLKYASEIRRLNESLEERVNERTLKLEEQNKILMEYAYINAHLLRGPLCRIQGLQQLMTFVSAEERPQIIEMMQVATGELDQVIKRITNSLESGQAITRSEITQINT